MDQVYFIKSSELYVSPNQQFTNNFTLKIGAKCQFWDFIKLRKNFFLILKKRMNFMQTIFCTSKQITNDNTMLLESWDRKAVESLVVI